ncbi:MAG: MurR/RpiR family transcriptional regulator [Oscillospiraceae bacterium]|nr:MurR/RpiR family transcriptional regulator [Oscillospiraceae bacterium]
MEKNLSTIKSIMPSLTKTERKIAEYILKEPYTVSRMLITELAKATGCAKSAVIRCCNSLGFSGFTELKLFLAEEQAKNRELNFTPYIYPQDNEGDILNKIFSANTKTLHDTAEKIDRTVLKKAIDTISSAERIYIYGVGTSSSVVNDFCYRLMLSGKNAVCFCDIASMKISTMNIKEGDVAICISHSGNTQATVDALRLSKERGAKTVSITGNQSSLIYKESDLSLLIFSDEINYPIEAISARIAYFSVIDAISIAVSARDMNGAYLREKTAHELISGIRYKEKK